MTAETLIYDAFEALTDTSPDILALPYIGRNGVLKFRPLRESVLFHLEDCQAELFDLLRTDAAAELRAALARAYIAINADDVDLVLMED